MVFKFGNSASFRKSSELLIPNKITPHQNLDLKFTSKRLSFALKKHEKEVICEYYN